MITTIRGEILRLLHLNGAMTAAALQAALPTLSRKQVIKALHCLSSANRIHESDVGYVTGEAPPNHRRDANGKKRMPSESFYRRMERDFRLKTNCHLQEGWRPEPDPAAAWMNNPTTIEEDQHA